MGCLPGCLAGWADDLARRGGLLSEAEASKEQVSVVVVVVVAVAVASFIYDINLIISLILPVLDLVDTADS